MEAEKTETWGDLFKGMQEHLHNFHGHYAELESQAAKEEALTGKPSSMRFANSPDTRRALYEATFNAPGVKVESYEGKSEETDTMRQSIELLLSCPGSFADRYAVNKTRGRAMWTREVVTNATGGQRLTIKCKPYMSPGIAKGDEIGLISFGRADDYAERRVLECLYLHALKIAATHIKVLDHGVGRYICDIAADERRRINVRESEARASASESLISEVVASIQ
jgi:hypothetical protein